MKKKYGMKKETMNKKSKIPGGMSCKTMEDHSKILAGKSLEPKVKKDFFKIIKGT